MKRYISILLSIILLVFTCCGCSLFSDSAKNGVLSIPRKGEEYYKRVVYNSDNSYISSTFLYNYLSISESNYDDSISKSKYKSVIFDQDARIVFDGADDKTKAVTIINGKIFTVDSKSKIYMTDIKSGDKEEFFSGYKPLDYKNGYWAVSNDNNKCGIIDEKGNEIIPCQYDSISLFDNKGYALVSSGGKCGMIDKNNDLLIPLNYTYLIPFNAKLNGAGAYSKLYLDYEPTYDFTMVADTDMESAFTIDRKGNKVFDLNDSEYKPVSGTWTLTQNLIPVKRDGLYGFIDMQGKEVIPLKYNGISWDFVNGYACVLIGENRGIINAKGEEVLPFEYSSITPFDQNGLAIARIESDDKTLVIDLAGNIAYKTNNSLEAIGGGYFEEKISDSKTEVIQITTDKNDYKTYTPKEFTVE